MAHQVLARKYRPQRFADVAGQEHVTVTLENALVQGRVAHGYIFSGHRGIGKTTVARILAMALNCRNAIGSQARPDAEPCEQCESCTEIRAGNAVDVIEIDAATNRGIDEIRELRDAARYRPARDRYKIYILDEAHQITDAAFNALLKTLEEPPEHIIFMLATTQPEDIPQTVRSRCQHYSFHAVPMAEILKQLRTIAEAEKVHADDVALNLLAEAGDGSMRDALSVMDQAIASAPVDGGSPRLDAAQIRELTGSVSNSVFERILDAVDSGRSVEVITIANELLDAGNSPAQMARQCVRYLRNCLVARVAGLTPETVDSDTQLASLIQSSPEEQRRAARTSARFSEEELTRFLQVMIRTLDDLGFRQEQRFRLELGLLKLVHLRRLLPVEEALSRLPRVVVGGAGSSAVRERAAAPPSLAASAAPVPVERAVFQRAGVSPPISKQPAPAPGPVAEVPSSNSASELQTLGVDALTRVGGQGSAADALGEAEWTVAGGVVRIQTTISAAMLPLVVNADAEKVLLAALRAAGTGVFTMELLPGKASPAGGAKKTKRAAAAGSAETKAEQHPVVQRARELFHAEIRKVIDLSEGK